MMISFIPDLGASHQLGSRTARYSYVALTYAPARAAAPVRHGHRCAIAERSRATVSGMGLSWQELILVLLIVLVLFGPKKLPEIGSSLGRGIRGFKSSLNGLDADESATPVTAASVTTAPAAEPVPVEVVEAPKGDGTTATH
jgi:sec-independent protein translocase protein TatA